MKKFLVFSVILMLCAFSPSVSADVNSDLELAKSYEGNFYDYHSSGGWYIFSDAGVNLGEPKPLVSDVNIEYFINNDEGYIIQYIRDSSNMSYVVWKDGTVYDMSSSLY